MDLEAMQLLNLSPIPELSELELSTMLDQLSGLSDVNGDLTDRNVEDILKEAEDLLDKSMSSKTHESKEIDNSQTTGKNQTVSVFDDNKEQNCQQLDLNESKHYNSPVYSDHIFHGNSPNIDDTKKSFSSSLEHTPTKNYSPVNSSNHIRSTIDSLKEFSTLIEKKLGTQSSNSFSTLNKGFKQNDTILQDKIVTIADNELKENLIGMKPVCNNSKTGKPNFIIRKNKPDPVSKSIKLLNCFERLYQDRPVRLNGDKKSKVSNKPSKTIVKKKFTKGSKKINGADKNVSPIKKNISAKIYPNNYSPTQSDLNEEGSLKQKKQYFSNNGNCSLQMKMSGTETKYELQKSSCVDGVFPSDVLKCVESSADEKLMLNALEGAGRIKDQTGKTGEFSDDLNEENIKLNLSGIDRPISNVGSEEEKFTSLSEKTLGIRRLEEQFSILKEKYDHQMAKLEAENLRLKEALKTQQKGFTPHMITNFDTEKSSDFEHTIETKSSKALILSSPSTCETENRTLQSVFQENLKVPKNSPCSSPENVQSSTAVKEAFSQTEKEVRSTSIQCSQDCKESGTTVEMVSEARRVENKENIKKKLGKSKPFSDVNIYQTMRQKKIFDHESQLLATLRGLQAEFSLKDKENRKLKIEIDSLRKQIKKSTNFKIEACRKCHIGTQTIGLSSFLQRPYNPENYEVPQQFEKENEELRLRIRALEEDFELLKEKRIKDLQSLHQVHEEEMAKLVSKLETQSALTRHLHSLLINR